MLKKSITKDAIIWPKYSKKLYNSNIVTVTDFK